MKLERTAIQEKPIVLESATFPETIDQAVSKGDGILGGYFTKPPLVCLSEPKLHTTSVVPRAHDRAFKRRHVQVIRKAKDKDKAQIRAR